MRYKQKKIGGKVIAEHRLIWKRYFGEIPKGYEIHHKDENKLNNSIENLQLVTRKEHIHIHELGQKNKIRIRGSKHPAELKKKISEGVKKHLPRTHFKKGNTPWNKGKKGLQKHNKETKKRISEKMKDIRAGRIEVLRVYN